ncbi:MAG: ATP-binding protein [Betaproteobacteria bacterium]|nr:ATP-binding protein [Betaproteobacteria bacterium]MDH5221294.1 ATP-binding protein [Betaproteobacteria bacterium]MDH5351935.1 ATP-binding protein [Betaproteobacteria bacterium]
MLAAALVRFPALRDLRVQFAALACVTALPFVAGAAYDIWFALQTSAGSLLTGPQSDVIEVRVGGLAIALIVSGLLAGLILYRMMPAAGGAGEEQRRTLRAADAAPVPAVEPRARDLERAIRELESYSSIITQNLRAPLRTIEACATLIERHHHSHLSAEGIALFRRLRLNAERMAEMLDGLIEYIRLGRRRMVVQPVDMTDLVRATIEEMRLPEADEARIAVDALPGVPADARLLAFAWRHLIDNALKFTAHAAERGIRIEGVARHGVAEYRVSDRGAGFDPAQEGKLFNLFERLHREDDFPGLGIGLATVKRIVERHGGCVWAEGAPGAGATFGFALPLGTAGPDAGPRH